MVAEWREGKKSMPPGAGEKGRVCEREKEKRSLKNKGVKRET